MSDYRCPNCGGGFPANALTRVVDGGLRKGCPWCETAFATAGADDSPADDSETVSLSDGLASTADCDRLTVKDLVGEVEDEHDEGAPIETVLDRAAAVGIERSTAEHRIEKLRRQGDVYESPTDHLRTV
jgi:DNA replicative helicase MCM subunit Mcm2 (Cdc46/Mcm family)